MKTLITGAGGQLGRSIESVFSREGRTVIALDRRTLDIRDESKVIHELERLRPNVLINCAAWTAVDLAEENKAAVFQINEEGVRLLAQSCEELDIKLVQISTDYVFSGIRDTPWQESNTPKPISVYGQSKAAGEAHVLSILGGNAFIVRSAWLYSSITHNFVYKMAEKALFEKGFVPVVNDQLGQPTSASDVANQLLFLLDSDTSGGIFHATNSGQATWFELAKEVFKLCDADTERVQSISTSQLNLAALRPSYSVLGHQSWLDSNIAPMRHWKDALADTLPKLIEAVRRENCNGADA